MDTLLRTAPRSPTRDTTSGLSSPSSQSTHRTPTDEREKEVADPDSRSSPEREEFGHTPQSPADSRGTIESNDDITSQAAADKERNRAETRTRRQNLEAIKACAKKGQRKADKQHQQETSTAPEESDTDRSQAAHASKNGRKSKETCPDCGRLCSVNLDNTLHTHTGLEGQKCNQNGTQASANSQNTAARDRARENVRRDREQHGGRDAERANAEAEAEHDRMHGENGPNTQTRKAARKQRQRKAKKDEWCRQQMLLLRTAGDEDGGNDGQFTEDCGALLDNTPPGATRLPTVESPGTVKDITDNNEDRMEKKQQLEPTT
jgi:hypothetical protein